MLRTTRRRIERAGNTYDEIRDAIRDIPADPALEGLSRREATTHLRRIKNDHTARFTRSMRRAFGVRVDLIADTPIDLAGRIEENVSLIKTIPERFHESLADDLAKMQQSAPFNKQRIRSRLARRYKSSGYNLRRLTRDQNNKLVGQLNQARQTEVGVERYIWQTAEDERVRETHAANNGKEFAWADPPAATGHPGEDIQCRCVALPVLTPPAAAPPGTPPADIVRPQTGLEARDAIGRMSTDAELKLERANDEWRRINRERLLTSRRRYDVPEGTPEWEALTDDLLRLEQQTFAADQAIGQAATELQDLRKRVISEVLEHGDVGPTISYRITGKVGKKVKAEIDRGVAQMRRLVRQWDDVYETRIHYSPNTRRAYHTRWGQDNHIVLSKSGRDDLTEVLIHEMGHSYEEQAAARLQRSVDHIYSRTKGDKTQKLSDLTGYNYGPKEVTRPDEFSDYYMGKEYGEGVDQLKAELWRENDLKTIVDNPFYADGDSSDPYLYGTEFTSTGLENMYTDPVGFARKDPTTFDWIFENVMR